MQINWDKKELNLKIVYYGPALSGKTTNIEQIHAHVNDKYRSKLLSLKNREDRTLYFDFLQLELGKIGGLTPRLNLYTVPGQVYYEATRKIVLRRADGIVFIADSAPNRLKDNIEAWENMKAQLTSLNLYEENFPIVVQMNKRDLPLTMPTEVIRAKLGIKRQYKIFEGSAVQNKGVFETFKAITQQVITRVQQEMYA
ncbi:MAG: GTPase domain-containing protein [Chlorobiales bacterium]|jgi:mutual gliding-motility protein MglA|nr:GTPase domain-containing protein [Chlorobiales bacterium]